MTPACLKGNRKDCYAGYSNSRRDAYRWGCPCEYVEALKHSLTIFTPYWRTKSLFSCYTTINSFNSNSRRDAYRWGCPCEYVEALKHSLTIFTPYWRTKSLFSCYTTINSFMGNFVHYYIYTYIIYTISFLLIVLTGLAGPALVQLMPVVPHNFSRKLHLQHWHFLEELLNKYPACNKQ